MQHDRFCKRNVVHLELHACVKTVGIRHIRQITQTIHYIPGVIRRAPREPPMCPIVLEDRAPFTADSFGI